MNRIFSAKTFVAALFVGTLDIIAAAIQYYLKTSDGPAPVLKFIASGLFGKTAFTGGNSMVLYGLLLHFLIAFIFTIFFFFLCNRFPSILRFKLLTGILYGCFIWAVMNLIVLPLSNAPKSSLKFTDAISGILILIICMGIPLAIIASRRVVSVK